MDALTDDPRVEADVQSAIRFAITMETVMIRNALQHRVILLEHALIGQQPDARIAEDRLDQDRAGGEAE